MIFEDITEFAAALPRAGAVAGLDLGTKTIGVAVSDGLRQVASPITVIRREKFTLDAQALLKIVADRGLVGLILGLPRNMDGSEGSRAQSTRAFARIRPPNKALDGAPAKPLWAKHHAERRASYTATTYTPLGVVFRLPFDYGQQRYA